MDQGSYIALEPGAVETVSAAVKDTAQKVILKNLQPIIICSPAIRRYLRKIVEQIDPSIMVISHAEIMQNIRIQSKGKVTLAHGD